MDFDDISLIGIYYWIHFIFFCVSLICALVCGFGLPLYVLNWFSAKKKTCEFKIRQWTSESEFQQKPLLSSRWNELVSKSIKPLFFFLKKKITVVESVFPISIITSDKHNPKEFSM